MISNQANVYHWFRKKKFTKYCEHKHKKIWTSALRLNGKLSFIFNQKLIENTHTIYMGKQTNQRKTKQLTIELNWIELIKFKMLSIDFHKNFQWAPVDWLQYVADIVIALSAVPIPLFFPEFHSENETN